MKLFKKISHAAMVFFVFALIFGLGSVIPAMGMASAPPPPPEKQAVARPSGTITIIDPKKTGPTRWSAGGFSENLFPSPGDPLLDELPVAGLEFVVQDNLDGTYSAFFAPDSGEVRPKDGFLYWYEEGMPSLLFFTAPGALIPRAKSGRLFIVAARKAQIQIWDGSLQYGYVAGMPQFRQAPYLEFNGPAAILPGNAAEINAVDWENVLRWMHLPPRIKDGATDYLVLPRLAAGWPASSPPQTAFDYLEMILDKRGNLLDGMAEEPSFLHIRRVLPRQNGGIWTIPVDEWDRFKFRGLIRDHTPGQARLIAGTQAERER